jgi:hypothetical protein
MEVEGIHACLGPDQLRFAGQGSHLELRSSKGCNWDMKKKEKGSSKTS